MNEAALTLWDSPDDLPVNAVLSSLHYLGPITRGRVYRDELGLMVFANPTSRQLPHDTWLELSRWCLWGGANAGSRQWSRAVRWLKREFPDVRTIVSYSDPSVGHTGALYKASGWLWAPTWHRLRPPPTGNGNWGVGDGEAVKDRWVFPLKPDRDRASFLRLNDEALRRRFPTAEYREPKWKRGRLVQNTGGGDYKQWGAIWGEVVEL